MGRHDTSDLILDDLIEILMSLIELLIEVWRVLMMALGEKV